MSASNVMPALRNFALTMPHPLDREAAQKIADAVAELVAADREYDDTQAAYQQARNNTAYAHLTARRVNAFHRAADRRAAALSKFQEGA